jgi:cold-inducible RNA-binding protein
VKIYVGNLSFNLSEDELKQKFEEFGSVNSVNIIKDRDTGKSKGFGFVEMAEKEAGDSAINEMNGQEYEGRRIIVNEARPRTDRPAGGSRDGGSRGGSRDGGSSRRW